MSHEDMADAYMIKFRILVSLSIIAIISFLFFTLFILIKYTKFGTPTLDKYKNRMSDQSNNANRKVTKSLEEKKPRKRSLTDRPSLLHPDDSVAIHDKIPLDHRSDLRENVNTKYTSSPPQSSYESIHIPSTVYSQETTTVDEETFNSNSMTIKNPFKEARTCMSILNNAQISIPHTISTDNQFSTSTFTKGTGLTGDQSGALPSGIGTQSRDSANHTGGSIVTDLSRTSPNSPNDPFSQEEDSCAKCTCQQTSTNFAYVSSRRPSYGAMEPLCVEINGRTFYSIGSSEESLGIGTAIVHNVQQKNSSRRDSKVVAIPKSKSLQEQKVTNNRRGSRSYSNKVHLSTQKRIPKIKEADSPKTTAAADTVRYIRTSDVDSYRTIQRLKNCNSYIDDKDTLRRTSTIGGRMNWGNNVKADTNFRTVGRNGSGGSGQNIAVNKKGYSQPKIGVARRMSHF